MGGHCLPVDPFYLAFKAREHDFYTEFIELAGKINQNQPRCCVERIEHALNDVAQAGQGLADPAPRRLLQGRRRRHPRVAGAEDHRGSRASWAARSPTTTPTSPSWPSSSCSSGRPRRGARPLRPRLHRHRAPRGRLRAGRRRGAPGARLPRRHPRHRGRQPRPPLARGAPAAQASPPGRARFRPSADHGARLRRSRLRLTGRRALHRRRGAADGAAPPRERAGGYAREPDRRRRQLATRDTVAVARRGLSRTPRTTRRSSSTCSRASSAPSR